MTFLIVSLATVQRCLKFEGRFCGCVGSFSSESGSPVIDGVYLSHGKPPLFPIFNFILDLFNIITSIDRSSNR